MGRNVRIVILVTSEEKNLLEQRASEMKLKLSPYCRNMLFQSNQSTFINKLISHLQKEIEI